MLQRVNHTLEPIYNKDSKILILGSIPSIKSRQYGFYYTHPQNKFWQVLSIVYNQNIGKSNEDKKEFLLANKIALWDVIKTCDIKNSSDSSIKNIEVNDINSLILKTKIKKVYTTGKKAYDLYNKYCLGQTNIKAIYLPSTSPANIGNYNLEELVNEYRQLIQS